jgi:hypothetical protein
MISSMMSLQPCKLLKSQQLSLGQKMVLGLAVLVPLNSGEVVCEKSQYGWHELT